MRFRGLLPAALVAALAWHGVRMAGRPLVPAVGSEDFKAATRTALLRLRPTRSYPAVARYIAEIREHHYSGMRVHAERPTFLVGWPTWNSSSYWYAGAIAHDAHHAKLYFEEKARLGGSEPDAAVWTGAEAEKKCLKVQYEALDEMGVRREHLDYIVSLSSAPTYQNHEVRDW